jgi:hypothetical protein
MTKRERGDTIYAIVAHAIVFAFFFAMIFSR